MSDAGAGGLMEWSNVSDAGASGLVEWSTVSDVRGVCTVHVKAAGSVQLASKTPRMRRIDDGGAASRLIRGVIDHAAAICGIQSSATLAAPLPWSPPSV